VLESKLAEEKILQDILNRLEKIEGYLNTPGGPIIHHINKHRADILSSVSRHDYINYSQVEQFFKLTNILPDFKDLPPLRGWAISPDVCLKLYDHLLSIKPKKIVEFGSGASTYIIAQALKNNGMGKLTSYDHSHEYSGKIRKNLESAGLIDFVDLKVAPLKSWDKNHLNEKPDENLVWYDRSLIDTVDDIDFVFIDGPPGLLCQYSRYPAVVVLNDSLSQDAEIWIDDANRIDEKEICENWAKSFDLELEFVPLEKGLGCLKKRPVE